MKQIVEILIEDIIITDRVRVDLGDIEALQNSIKSRGQLYPIIVEKKTMELVDGFRRYTSIKNLGLKKIDAQFYEELSKIDKKIMELHSNFHKELTWDEKAKQRAEIHALRQEEKGTAVKGHASSGQSLEDSAFELGVSTATLSQDITLSKAIEILPNIAKFGSKKQAIKQLKGLEEMIALRELARRDAAESKEASGKEIPYVAIEGEAVEKTKSNISDNVIDLVFYDPPWGIDADINATSRGPRGEKIFYNDSPEEALNLSFQMLPEIFRILKMNCHMYMFVGVQYMTFWTNFLTNTIMTIHPEMLYEDQSKLITYEPFEKDRSWKFEVRPMPLIWVKEGGGYTDHEYKIMPRYETLLFCSKGPGKRLNFPITDVLEYNRPLSTERFHPQQKSLLFQQMDEFVLLNARQIYHTLT